MKNYLIQEILIIQKKRSEKIPYIRIIHDKKRPIMIISLYKQLFTMRPSPQICPKELQPPAETPSTISEAP